MIALAPLLLLMTVESVFCAEVDPFVVGDVCIVLATSDELGDVVLVGGEDVEVVAGDELALPSDSLSPVIEPAARLALGADRPASRPRRFLWWDGRIEAQVSTN